MTGQATAMAGGGEESLLSASRGQSALVRWGLVLVATLIAVALLAEVLSPHDPESQIDPATSSRRPPLSRLWELTRQRCGPSVDMRTGWPASPSTRMSFSP